MKKVFCWLFALLQKFLRRDKTASVAVVPSRSQGGPGEISCTIPSSSENTAEESAQPSSSIEANLESNSNPKGAESNAIGKDVNSGSEEEAASAPPLLTAEKTENAEAKNEETERRKFAVETGKEDDNEMSEMPESNGESNTESSDDGSVGESKKAPSHRQSPILTGGKRGKVTSEKERNTERKNPFRGEMPRAQFVCIQRADGWIVAVEARGAKEARQGEKCLEHKDDIFFPIQNVGEETVVSFKDETEESLLLSDDLETPLIFQTSRNWKGEKGRLVKEAASGYYIVFAPESCGKRISRSPVEPESTNWPQWKAHYFAPKEGQETDGFSNCQCMAVNNRFRLLGDVIADDSKEGDIFVLPPKIKDADGWKGLSWLIYGREDGKGTVGKINLKERPPAPVNLAEILEDQSGRFFVRIYEEGCNGDFHKLVYSFDFRYWKGLAGVQVNGVGNWNECPIFPKENGHNKMNISFIGNGFTMALSSSGAVKKDGYYEIPAEASADKTCWEFKNELSESILVNIAIPRVWWKLDAKNEKWLDMPITVSRNNLRASESELFVRVGIRSSIEVGFSSENRNGRKYPARFEKNEDIWIVKIPLSEFSDDIILEQSIEQDVFLCVFLRDGKNVKLIHIPADAPLPNSESTQPRRRSPCHCRRRALLRVRFSCLEIRKSDVKLKSTGKGLWRVLSTGREIRIDKRRKSAHSKNIQALAFPVDSEN